MNKLSSGIVIGKRLIIHLALSMTFDVGLCKIKLSVKIMTLDEDEDCECRERGGFGSLILKICLSVRNPWWNFFIAYYAN